jgi:hypothetical protein
MRYYKWFGRVTDNMQGDIARYIKKGSVVIALPDDELIGATEAYGWKELSKVDLLIELNRKTPILKYLLESRGRWRKMRM